MLQSVKRCLRMMRCCCVSPRWALSPEPSPSPSSSSPIVVMPPSAPAPLPTKRDSMRRSASCQSTHVDRMSATVQSAAMPLRRLVQRVKSRLSLSKLSESSSALRPYSFDVKSGRKTSHVRLLTGLESYKFYIWSGGAHDACGWSLRRKFLVEEAQFAWCVSRVTSEDAWERYGVRPGDVLETIGAVSLSRLTREDQVTTLLRAAMVGTVLRFRVRAPYDRCRVERFTIPLRGESLGITLIADGSDAVPVVFAVSRTASRIELGDVLCEVNGTSVIGWGVGPALTKMNESLRTGTLTFQRWSHDACAPCCRFHALQKKTYKRSSRSRGSRRWILSGAEFHDSTADEETFYDEEDYEYHGQVVIIWRSGVLGLTLLKDASTKMPMVNRLTGKGTTPGIEGIQHGYHLVSINGVSTVGRRFRDVIHDLICMKKPLRLVFQSPEPRESTYEDGDFVDNLIQSWASKSSAASSKVTPVDESSTA